MNHSNGPTCGKESRQAGNIVANHQTKVITKDALPPKYTEKCFLTFVQLCLRKGQDPDQQILDIGCGNGQFTRNELLPQCLPCRRIVAVDVSPAQLKQARDHSSHPKIVYDFLDIGKDVSAFLNRYGQFDRIYSFTCLHWTDLEVSLNNIEKLLTPGGECLLITFISNQSFDWWRKIVQKESWKKYAQIVEEFLPKLPATPDRNAVLRSTLDILEAAKLKLHMFECVADAHILVPDVEVMIKTVLSPNPLVPLLSPEENKQFEEDLAALIRDDMCSDGSSGQKTFTTDFVLVHASK